MPIELLEEFHYAAGALLEVPPSYEITFALQLVAFDDSVQRAATALRVLDSLAIGHSELLLNVKRLIRDFYITRLGPYPSKRDVKEALAQQFGKGERKIQAQVLNAHRQMFGEQYLKTGRRRKGNGKEAESGHSCHGVSIRRPA